MFLAKTEEEIELLRLNNELVSKTLAEVAKLIQPGVTTLELDKRAEEFIRDNGAIPGFLGYNGYPKTLCTSVNSAVVHGIPSSFVLRDGDIVSIDCGTFMHGYYGDSAYTFAVGEISPEVQRLLKVTQECLELGVSKAINGARVGDVSSDIQSHAETNGYSVVRELVGHGIGKKMHEKPEIPNYGAKGRGPKLVSGMVICIEPMINMGTKSIFQENDGWTIKTTDGKPSAHYELAIAIRKGKAERLSTFKYIEEVLNKD